jgi:hypothetical protein
MTRDGPATAVLEHPQASQKSQKTRPAYSPLLTAIQQRADSPFGMQFLTVPLPQPQAVYRGRIVAKVSTSEPTETSNDSKNGSTKTDWEDDEDNWKD